MNHEDVKNVDAHSFSKEGAVVCDTINTDAGLQPGSTSIYLYVVGLGNTMVFIL